MVTRHGIETMKKENRETPRKKFIQIVKKKGIVPASLSHTQQYPGHISSFAVLEWQYDPTKGELFSITKSGKRVVANEKMPAFHIWRIREVAIERYRELQDK